MTSLIELARSLAASPTLLIVEDDVSAASILLKMLECYDCTIIHASTVGEGINEVISRRYDLAFIDLVFPEGSGVDVIRTIKSHRPDTPIVVMTGFLTHEYVQEALSYGVVALMRKPVDFCPEYIKSVLETFRVRVRPKDSTTDLGSSRSPAAHPQPEAGPSS